MTPEEKARQEIDRQLAACGWVVKDHKAMNIMAGPGVAVREFPLKTGSGREWLKRKYAAGRTRQAGEPASVLLERIRNARAAESPQRSNRRRKSPA